MAYVMNSTLFHYTKLNILNTIDVEIERQLAIALHQIITEFFLTYAHALVITVCCKSAEVEGYYRSLLENVVRTKDLHTQLVYVDFSRPQRIEGLRLSNLIMVDSLEAFLRLDINYYTKMYNTNEFYYIILQQSHVHMESDVHMQSDMEGIFAYCWQHQMIHCNVQTQGEQQGIRMYTYYPYTSRKCGDLRPAQINTFFKATGWQHKTYYPDKLHNFYRCPLRVAVRHMPPFVKLFNSSDGELRATGFEGEIIEELADYLNFTTKYILIEVDDRTMNFCCGIVNKLKNRLTDIVIGYIRIRPIMEDKATIILPYFMDSLVSSVLINAHNLSTYEILTYSFDRPSWLAILATFWLILLCAELLHRSQEHQLHARTFERERFFSLSRLLAATLGVALASVPQQPHNRLLYATALWTTFLLRSLYATFIYCLFRDNIHSPLPATTRDLLTQNYVGVMNLFAFKDLTRLPNDGGYADIPLIIYDDADELIAFPHLERNPGERLVAVSAKEFLVYYVTTNRRAGVFHIVRQIIHNQHITMYVIKHSMFSRQFDISVLRLNEVGLVERLKNRKLDEHYFRSNHWIGQQLIRQQDLVSIYIIGAVLQAMALGVFLMELLSKRFKTLRLIFN